MFQSSKEARDTNDIGNIKSICKIIFKAQNIIIYVLTFLISMVSIKNEVLPFGLAIIAACLGTEIPIAVVFGLSSISTFAFHGINGFGTFFFTCLVYFLSVILFKPKYSIEERNEIVKTGGKLFFACFIISLINNIRGVFLVYNLFMGTIISVLTYCFYKIFVNGIVVFRDFGEKKAFSLEELVGAAIIVGIASLAFSKLNILGMNVSNVIIIFLILVLGWKNGMLLGGVSGIAVGLATGIVGMCSIVQIAAFAVAGIFAGLLNKFGKFGVIVGFILGNSILTYLYSGNIETIIYFREIFVASVGLLLVPSNIKINLEDIIGKNKLISDEGEYRLESNSEVKRKLNVVAEAISEITKKITMVEEEVSIEAKKDSFTQILETNMEGRANNIFYEDIYKNIDNINSDIFMVLQKNDVITKESISEIFRIHNNFIVDQYEYIKDDLNELVDIINRSYKMNSIDNAKKEEKKVQNNKMVNELESVKKIINDVAQTTDEPEDGQIRNIEKEIGIVLSKKNLAVKGVRYRKIDNGKIVIDLKMDFSEELRKREKIVNIESTISKVIGKKVAFQKDKKSSKNDLYIQTYSTEDKFAVQLGVSKITKENSDFSGDSNLAIKLDDGKYLMALSDGMGTGLNARQTSASVLKVLKNFLMAGFEKQKTIELINSSLNLDLNEEMYASLDLAILDLYEGVLYSIKNGSSKTYVKSKKNITVLNSEQMPLGIVNEISLTEKCFRLSDGDIVVLVSDGILESKDITKNDWLEEFLKNAGTNNVQKLSDLILAEALDNSYGTAGDDMTVMVAKVIKKK